MARRRRPSGGERRYWLYGTHAVRAALHNPERDVCRLLLTAAAAKTMPVRDPNPAAEIVESNVIDQLFRTKVVHQGAAVEVLPLRHDAEAIAARLTEGGPRRLAVVLDQVSDPQNVGAILRSAWAFGACAAFVPAHGAPPETGALAKAACGALDHVPYVAVGNLAQFLARFRDTETVVVGLDADAEEALDQIAARTESKSVILVLGAEGTGMRRLTRERCTAVARIPMPADGPSLNVSNAAAVALYIMRVGIHQKLQ